MPRIWKEKYDGRRYGDRNSKPQSSYAITLDNRELICVNVCSFTFKFVSKDEIMEYIAFFQQKTHPTSRVPESRLPDCDFRHWHSQRWYERLPLYLQENAKREKVLKALQKALALIDTGKL
jgi:hypothetical protein